MRAARSRMLCKAKVTILPPHAIVESIPRRSNDQRKVLRIYQLHFDAGRMGMHKCAANRFLPNPAVTSVQFEKRSEVALARTARYKQQSIDCYLWD